jgi:hypothetical protein
MTRADGRSRLVTPFRKSARACLAGPGPCLPDLAAVDS